MKVDVKNIIWLWFKIFLIFVLCLAAYTWIQRKNIANLFVRRHLAMLRIKDLDFTISELSPFACALTDISWGDREDPFLYVSSVKASYKPLEIIRGSIENVKVGYVATRVSFDKNNRATFELMERSLLAVEHFNQLYPASEKEGDKIYSLPDLTLNKLTIEVHDVKGVEQGQIELKGTFSEHYGSVRARANYALPGGRGVVVKSDLGFDLLQSTSPLSLNLEGELDFSDLSGASVKVTPETLDFKGCLNISPTHAWRLSIDTVPKTFNVGNNAASLKGSLASGVKVFGSKTNLCVKGGLRLTDLALSPPRLSADIEFESRAEGVALDFELPHISFDNFADMAPVFSIALTGLNCSVGDTVEVDDFNLSSDFSVCEQVVAFEKPVLSCAEFSVGGFKIEPSDLRLAVTNNSLSVKTSLAVSGESLSAAIECGLPLSDLRNGFITVEIPTTRVDSKGELGRILVEKSGEHADFSGTVSTYMRMESFKPGGTITGVVLFADGELIKEKLVVSDVDMTLPFKFDKKLRSVGTPLLRVKSVDAGNIHMSDGEVLFQFLEDELLVERARIGWAKGYLRAHSIRAGFDGDIKNEFTIYADRVDLGEVFSLVMPFDGRMEGVLYGRFPVSLKNKRVKLSNGFLYSLPGQGGVLKLNNPADMGGLLERAGISSDLQGALSHALSDVVFSAIRFDLENGASEESVLRIKLDGESKYEEWPAPVDLNINLYGPLESIINLGVDMRRFKSDER